MSDDPMDLTQKVLIDIQEQLARIEKKQDEGNLFMRDVALRATLIDLRCIRPPPRFRSSRGSRWSSALR